MSDPQDIQTLEDVIRWLTDQNARSEVRWEFQHEFNKSTKLSVSDLSTRVTAVEKKLIWACGFASAVGSILGLIAGGVFKLLGG